MPYWYNREWCQYSLVYNVKQLFINTDTHLNSPTSGGLMWVMRLMECSDNHLYSAVRSSGAFYYMECLHLSPLLSCFQTRRQSCVWNAVGLNVPRCRPHCSCGEQQLKSSPQNFSSGINNRSFDIPEAQNVPEHWFWRFSLSHLVGILQGLSSIIWLLE